MYSFVFWTLFLLLTTNFYNLSLNPSVLKFRNLRGFFFLFYFPEVGTNGQDKTSVNGRTVIVSRVFGSFYLSESRKTSPSLDTFVFNSQVPMVLSNLNFILLESRFRSCLFHLDCGTLRNERITKNYRLDVPHSSIRSFDFHSWFFDLTIVPSECHDFLSLFFTINPGLILLLGTFYEVLKLTLSTPQ